MMDRSAHHTLKKRKVIEHYTFNINLKRCRDFAMQDFCLLELIALKSLYNWAIFSFSLLMSSPKTITI